MKRGTIVHGSLSWEHGYRETWVVTVGEEEKRFKTEREAEAYLKEKN